MTLVLILVNTTDKQECLCIKTFLAASIIKNLQGLKHATKMGFYQILKEFTLWNTTFSKNFFVQMEIGDKNVAIDWKTSLTQALCIEIKQSKIRHSRL